MSNTYFKKENHYLCFSGAALTLNLSAIQSYDQLIIDHCKQLLTNEQVLNCHLLDLINLLSSKSFDGNLKDKKFQ